MTYRGIFQNGIVILEDASGLRDGQSVEVLPDRAAKGGSPAAKKPTGRKRSKAARPKGALPSLGLWRDRVEFSNAAAAARRLRKRTSRRARSKGSDPLPGFGIWKDRTDLGRTTAEIARNLRKKAMGRS